jgi:hypothetical protein
MLREIKLMMFGGYEPLPPAVDLVGCTVKVILFDKSATYISIRSDKPGSQKIPMKTCCRVSLRAGQFKVCLPQVCVNGLIAVGPAVIN